MDELEDYCKRMGARSLAVAYVKYKREKERNEIRWRIEQEGGQAIVSTWENSERDWLDGGYNNEQFVEFSVGLMPHTEVPPPGSAPPPNDLVDEDWFRF